jgi:hypothetical protein
MTIPSGSRRPCTRTFLALLVGIAALVLRAPASGDVKPGDVITAANVDQAKDLISPGLEWCVKHGLPMKIGETKAITWPKAYKDATEKFSGQVKLAADGLTLRNFVAGQPFPDLDTNDPDRHQDHVELRIQARRD